MKVKCAGKWKNRYPSRTAAVEVAANRSRKEFRPLRTYKCPACEGFHLTSKPLMMKVAV